jgi:hypothetical protein
MTGSWGKRNETKRELMRLLHYASAANQSFPKERRRKESSPVGEDSKEEAEADVSDPTALSTRFVHTLPVRCGRWLTMQCMVMLNVVFAWHKILVSRSRSRG